MSIERRTAAGSFRVAAAQSEKSASPDQLIGYAAVFNEITTIGGLFRERIAPGAFRRAAASDDCRCLFNHDANQILGRTSSGTLRLWEDDRGLRYCCDLPTWATAIAESVSRGDVSQSSFAFQVQDEDWDFTGPLPLRTIRSARLFDVSPVTYPAYDATTVSAI